MSLFRPMRNSETENWKNPTLAGLFPNLQIFQQVISNYIDIIPEPWTYDSVMKIGGRLSVPIKDYTGAQALVAYTFETCWNGMVKYKQWYDEATTFENAKKTGIIKTENYLADWTGAEVKNSFLTSGMTMFREAGVIEHMNQFLDWVLMMSPKQFFIKSFIERMRLEIQS